MPNSQYSHRVSWCIRLPLFGRWAATSHFFAPNKGPRKKVCIESRRNHDTAGYWQHCHLDFTHSVIWHADFPFGEKHLPLPVTLLAIHTGLCQNCTCHWVPNRRQRQTSDSGRADSMSKRGRARIFRPCDKVSLYPSTFDCCKVQHDSSTTWPAGS